MFRPRHLILTFLSFIFLSAPWAGDRLLRQIKPGIRYVTVASGDYR